MNPLSNIESLWIEQRKAQFRREHALNWWRTVAVVAVVTAACGWAGFAVLVFIK